MRSRNPIQIRWHCLIRGGLILMILTSMTSYALAEENKSPPDNLKQKLEDIVKGGGADNANPKKLKAPNLIDTDPARPAALSKTSSDPETKRLYEKALQDYYSYRSTGLDHRGAVFRWQLFSAKVIFFVVLSLVSCGIVFAGIQFRAGLNGNNGGGSAKGDRLASTIEVGSTGIKVTSPVLGVVILFLSLAFFYLYLVYVYPIENVF